MDSEDIAMSESERRSEYGTPEPETGRESETRRLEMELAASGDTMSGEGTATSPSDQASTGSAEGAGPAPRPASAGLRRRLASLTVAGALILGALGGGVASGATTLYLWSQRAQAPQFASAVAAPLPSSGAPATGVNASYRSAVDGTIAEIYRRVSPAVVTVKVREGAARPSAQTPQGRPPAEGEGTGFVVDAQGRILTNNHVVADASQIVVRLVDGTELPAKVVGADPSSDVAVIQAQIPSDKLAIATLGDSSLVQPGDPAIAIGSPFGLDHSVTAGIISGTGRTFGTAGGRPMRGLIQTDTPINPGNSGGPILNAKGEVVGIATSIESPVRGSVGVGFAIPVNAAKRLLPQLIAGQDVQHPWIGISGVALTSSLAERLGVPVVSGVLVAEVVPGGPAEQAGLRGSPSASAPTDVPVGGDVIVAIDDVPVRSVEDIGGYLDSRSVGDRVTLSVLRDGRKLELPATLAPWPSSQAS